MDEMIVIVLIALIALPLIVFIICAYCDARANAYKFTTIAGYNTKLLGSYIMPNGLHFYNTAEIKNPDFPGAIIHIQNNSDYKLFYVSNKIWPNHKNINKGNVIACKLNDAILPESDKIPVGVFSIKPTHPKLLSHVMNLVWIKMEINPNNTYEDIKQELMRAARTALSHSQMQRNRREFAYPGDNVILNDFRNKVNYYINDIISNKYPNLFDLTVYITTNMDGDNISNNFKLELRTHADYIGRAAYTFTI